jgi:glycerol-3-phosphate acyltransferase PlsY
VATSAGDLPGLLPLSGVSVIAVWVILFQFSRYVSVASIGAAVALPLFVMLYLRLDLLTGASLLPFSILIAGVVVWRHRSNMKRLFQGKEQRFDQK